MELEMSELKPFYLPGGVMTAEQFVEVEISDSVKDIVSTGIIQFSDGDVSSGQDVTPCDGQV